MSKKIIMVSSDINYLGSFLGIREYFADYICKILCALEFKNIQSCGLKFSILLIIIGKTFSTISSLYVPEQTEQLQFNAYSFWVTIVLYLVVMGNVISIKSCKNIHFFCNKIIFAGII